MEGGDKNQAGQNEGHRHCMKMVELNAKKRVACNS